MTWTAWIALHRGPRRSPRSIMPTNPTTAACAFVVDHGFPVRAASLVIPAVGGRFSARGGCSFVAWYRRTSTIYSPFDKRKDIKDKTKAKILSENGPRFLGCNAQENPTKPPFVESRSCSQIVRRALSRPVALNRHAAHPTARVRVEVTARAGNGDRATGRLVVRRRTPLVRPVQPAATSRTIRPDALAP